MGTEVWWGSVVLMLASAIVWLLKAQHKLMTNHIDHVGKSIDKLKESVDQLPGKIAQMIASFLRDRPPDGH